MKTEAFSEGWATQWCQHLNERTSYRQVAANWEGAVALIMTRDGSEGSPRRAVFLDLWHGQCRAARVASTEDLDTAAYVLSGTLAAWREVLTGKMAPLMAFMGGKIRLSRGSMSSLLPYAAAARELVATAVEMEVRFPEDW